MRILLVHGVGHQEKNPTSWQPLWEKTMQDVLENGTNRSALRSVSQNTTTSSGDTPLTVGGTVGGFGRPLWDEVEVLSHRQDFGLVWKAARFR